MKQSKKHLHTFATFVLLVFALLCITRVTYSYFTATAKKSGSMSFSTIDVSFMYYEDVNGFNSVTVAKQANGQANSLKIVPSTGTIARGVPFEFNLASSGARIYNLSIQSGGCDVYVRFWIDAYIKTGNTLGTTNYGKYFLLEEGASKPYTKQNSSSLSSTCYYGKIRLGDDTENGIYPTLTLGNTLTLSDLYDDMSGELSDAVPVELMGEQLEISISFEAVQAANKAYSSVFNDTKGYYKSWS